MNELQHTVFDIYNPTPDYLSNRIAVEDFIDDLLQFLNLKRAGPDSFTSFNDLETDREAFTILVPLTTSHLAYHSWDAYRVINLDLFTCSKFCIARCYSFINDYLRPTRIVYRQIPRPNLDNPDLHYRQTEPLD